MLLLKPLWNIIIFHLNMCGKRPKPTATRDSVQYIITPLKMDNRHPMSFHQGNRSAPIIDQVTEIAPLSFNVPND